MVFHLISATVYLSLCLYVSPSQGKEFSYSELDLRKPKRFATFSFGFKKKKKRDYDENISKSTFGLSTAINDDHEEVMS